MADKSSGAPVGVAAAERAPQVARASYEEYLARRSEGPLVEWVRGEIIRHAMPTLPHQDLVAWLLTVSGVFASFFDLGKIFSAPVELKCGGDNGPSREPDLLFVSKSNLQRIVEKRLDGPADLVIEVVSDDSVARDYDEKFIEYQECGVSEYWIVDPRERRKRALFYQLGDDGLFESVKPEEGRTYRSKVLPGFWLRIDWLWELPDPLLTFAEIAGFSEQTMADLQARKQSAA